MRPNDIMRIAEAVSSVTGEGFFHSFANSLANVLGSDYALVGILDDSGQSVKTIAFSANGEIVDNVEYAIANTPCQEVVKQGGCTYTSSVRQLFCGNRLFDKLEVEAFLGAPLKDSQGDTLGLVAVMYKREIDDVDNIQSTLRIFAVRAVAEIERMRVEEKLKLSERRMELALEGGDLGFWDWNIATGETYFSPRYYTMLGYEPGELPATYDTWKDLLHPDEREATTKALQNELEKGFPAWDIVFRLRNKNGEFRHILGRGRIVEFDEEGNPLRAAGTHMDITDSVLAEQAVHDSEQRITDLIRRLPSGIQECDKWGKITFMSQTFEKMMGFEPGEGLGKKVWDFMVDDERGKGLPQYLEYLADEQPPPTPWVCKNATKDGRVIDVQVDWDYMRDDAGKVTGFASIISDITDRVSAENERRELEAQLRQSEKLNALGTLAGGIAHDFNNILTSIIGYSELTLLSLSSGTDEHENLVNIFNAGQRAKEIIARILAFSRKTDDHRKSVLVNPIVRETEKLLSVTLPLNVTLVAELPEKSPCILADPAQIQQVLVNLCTNAHQSMGGDGGEIRVSVGTVQHIMPGSGRAEEFVRIIVRDNGSGIDEVIRERVFEPYFTTKEVGAGSGLGLAVVHGIVFAHEGTISVESAPGQGTEFQIFFPTHMGEEEVTKRTEEVDQGNGERVLFVDDEPMLAELAELSLVSLGYKPEVFTDPAAALERLSATPLKFDIIVTDLAMPAMAGRELIQKARAIRSDIPIVICTGHSDNLNVETLESDPIVMLHKPWTRSQLSKVLRKALEKRS